MVDPYVKLLIPGIPYKTKYGGFGYCSISLIKDNSDTILFDVGHYSIRGEIIKILSKNKINKVFISHLHYDHCLNLDLFLKKGIKIYLNKNEFEYLDNINRNDIYTFKFFKKIIKKNDLNLFDREFHLSKNIYVLKTYGHSIGHSSLVFKKHNKNYIVAGDAIKTFKDFKNIKSSDIVPYDYKQLVKVKRYIASNFNIIIPGHSNVIIDGKKPSNNLTIFDF